MAFKVHQITRYVYAFDARSGSPGNLQLWSDSVKIAEVTFVSETASLPAPAFTADLNSATIAFRRSAHAGLIDMLRNETPCSLTINNQSPGFVFVGTGLEPAGEGES